MTETSQSHPSVQAGMQAFQAGEYPAAAAHFAEAAQAYAADGDAPAAAEMQNNRSVALLKAGKAGEALEAANGTDEVFAQIADLRRQGMALGNQAAALEALGQLKEALEKYEHSAELLKKTNETQLRAHVLESLSALQIRTGNQLQAMATMQSALASKKKLSLKDRLLNNLLKVPLRMMHH